VLACAEKFTCAVAGCRRLQKPQKIIALIKAFGSKQDPMGIDLNE
jgi:hypothetical protein